MKKLHLATLAAAFALATTGAMAQSTKNGAVPDTRTPAAANSGTTTGSGMRNDMKANNSGNADANAMDAQRGTQEPAKGGGASNPATKTAPGATKEAH
jgi:hypothetical protein